MVEFENVRSKNFSIVNSAPLVAVFVGGTSGIGEYTIQALVNNHSNAGQGLTVFIVGRNAEAASKTITECQERCPRGKYFFIQVQDLSLIRDVDRAVAGVIQRLEQDRPDNRAPRVDLLVMTQGGLYLGPREWTEESIDFEMSMHYYSRARFAYQFLPLLRESGFPAHVITVYAAGMEDTLYLDDLELKNPKNVSFTTKRSHCTFMITGFFEKLANDEEGKISFVNMFPGLVITPGFGNSNYPWWFKVLWTLISPIARAIWAIPPEESGQRVLYLASDRFPPKSSPRLDGDVARGTDGVQGSGAYACGPDCGTTSQVKRDKVFLGIDKGEFIDSIWKHTLGKFDQALSC